MLVFQKIRRANGPGRARSCPWIMACGSLTFSSSPGTPGTLPPPGSVRPGLTQGSLFVLGPPSGPQSEFDPPPSAPLWNCFCSAPRSGDPLGTFQKSFKAKNENVKTSPGFTSKLKPWRTFADPGPPKKGPLGPDPLFRGPPWKFLRGQTHVSGPSLAPLENPSEPNSKKTCFFKKTLKPL